MFSIRSWGFYLTLWSGKHFKAKILYFKKGHHCSLQRHFKRSETWHILYGGGDLEGDDIIPYAKRGDFFNIPVKSWHQFHAHKRTWVLEIQYGDCKESDIERV